MKPLLALLFVASQAFAQWTLVLPTDHPVTSLFVFRDTLYAGTWGGGVYSLADSSRDLNGSQIEHLGDAWGELAAGVDCDGFLVRTYGIPAWTKYTKARNCTEAFIQRYDTVWTAPNAEWLSYSADRLTWWYWRSEGTIRRFCMDSLHTLYAAHDEGVWQISPVYAGIFRTATPCWSIAYNACDSSLIVAATEGVFRRKAGVWSRLGNLPWSYAVIVAGGTVYVGTASHGDWSGSGLYRWRGDWERVGFDSLGVAALAVWRCKLYAGTWDGVYSSPICFSDTTRDTLTVHDTTQIHDTVKVLVNDTLRIRDSVVWYLHDTTLVTRLVHDTIVFHDTVSVRDTVTYYRDTLIVSFDRLWPCDTAAITYTGGEMLLYPLPANRRIGYELTGKFNAQILLFDAIGRLVAIEERVAPYKGWIGDALPGGAYWLVLNRRSYRVVVQ